MAPSWSQNKITRLLEGLPPSQGLGGLKIDVVHAVFVIKSEIRPNHAVMNHLT